MQAIPTAIPEVFVIEPKVFGDDRGFFFESYNRRAMAHFGLDLEFVQDNHSRSARNVLRGMHYQHRHPQGKLVRVISGEVFDVAVDLRRSSNTFGHWVATTLSAENKRMMWIPPGFAHGFLTLSESADFLYKTTDYWHPEDERCLIWNDAQVAIAWPLTGRPQLAAKDSAGLPLDQAEVFP